MDEIVENMKILDLNDYEQEACMLLNAMKEGQRILFNVHNSEFQLPYELKLQIGFYHEDIYRDIGKILDIQKQSLGYELHWHDMNKKTRSRSLIYNKYNIMDILYCLLYHEVPFLKADILPIISFPIK